MEKYKFLYRRSATAIILVELKTGVRQLWTTKSTDGETFELNGDRKSTRLNSSHIQKSRMPSSA